MGRPSPGHPGHGRPGLTRHIEVRRQLNRMGSRADHAREAARSGAVGACGPVRTSIMEGGNAMAMTETAKQDGPSTDQAIRAAADALAGVRGRLSGCLRTVPSEDCCHAALSGGRGADPWPAWGAGAPGSAIRPDAACGLSPERLAGVAVQGVGATPERLPGFLRCGGQPDHGTEPHAALRRLRQGCRVDPTYPAHDFALDLEELAELGLPARSPSAAEAPHVEALALALIEFGTAKDLIEMAGPSPTTRAAEQKVMEEIPVKKERAGLPRNRAKRKQTARKGDAHGRTAA